MVYILSFLTAELICGLVKYFHVSEGAKALAESGILLLLPAGVHVFAAEVGLFSVLQGSQFHLKETYLAYHRSRELY